MTSQQAIEFCEGQSGGHLVDFDSDEEVQQVYLLFEPEFRFVKASIYELDILAFIGFTILLGRLRIYDTSVSHTIILKHYVR